MKEGDSYLRASAVVFEGDGFRSAMGRAVATGLSLVARPKFPFRAHAMIPAAVQWLAEVAPEYDSAELAEVLAAIRNA